MAASELFERAVSLVFPQKCFSCTASTDYDSLFCQSCPHKTVGRLLLPFEHRLSGVGAVHRYKGQGRRIVWALKAGKPLRMRILLASQMHRLAALLWPGVHFDVIVPVPSTRAALRQRGFNHSQLLAQELSKKLKVPVCRGALVRDEASLVQHSLNRAMRKENAQRSFGVGSPGLVSGKRVLLVDDLITTGHTVAACGACLLQAGASEVFALCASATPTPGASTGTTGHRPALVVQ